MKAPPARRIVWRRAFRILPSRYPPIALFERVADPEDWEALIEVESLTNERLRDAVGDICRVPASERVSGPGASWVMAAFTHVGRPSRFSDGTFGIYYAAHTLDCAVAETTYHWARFLAATAELACDLDMRVLTSGIRGTLHDLRPDKKRWAALYDPDDYTASQAFGLALRAAGSHGIAYESVRLAGHDCVALFRPRVVDPLPSGDHFLLYHFDGRVISRYYDHVKKLWLAPPPTRSRVS